MIEVDVIGGKSDGAKIRTAPRIVVSLKLEGDEYIALAFKPDKDAKKDVMIYAWTGISPAAAVAMWKSRR